MYIVNHRKTTFLKTEIISRPIVEIKRNKVRKERMSKNGGEIRKQLEDGMFKFKLSII